MTNQTLDLKQEGISVDNQAHPHANRCLDYIVNKIEHVQRGPCDLWMNNDFMCSGYSAPPPPQLTD